jgi:sugar phosphate isomerase/epimerase
MKRPFRIGTTSFIYPDHILPNVRRIGRFFDEIELLIFESMPKTVLPEKTEITEMARLSETLDVTYNIHLPTDVSLTHPAAWARQHAAETIARVVDLCRPLTPSTHTLHLEMEGDDTSEKIDAWQELAQDGLARLMRYLPDPGILSVETLDYPPDYLLPLLDACDLQVCLDIGHHFRYGYDLKHSVDMFKNRIAVMHLHGVAASKQKIRDHVSLDRLPLDQLCQVMDVLKKYQGTVSLEVFNRLDLNRSLAVLSDVFDDIPSRLPG